MQVSAGRWCMLCTSSSEASLVSSSMVLGRRVTHVQYFICRTRGMGYARAQHKACAAMHDACLQEPVSMCCAVPVEQRVLTVFSLVVLPDARHLWLRISDLIAASTHTYMCLQQMLNCCLSSLQRCLRIWCDSSGGRLYMAACWVSICCTSLPPVEAVLQSTVTDVPKKLQDARL
jgi:hypothetical protein